MLRIIHRQLTVKIRPNEFDGKAYFPVHIGTLNYNSAVAVKPCDARTKVVCCYIEADPEICGAFELHLLLIVAPNRRRSDPQYNQQATKPKLGWEVF